MVSGNCISWYICGLEGKESRLNNCHFIFDYNAIKYFIKEFFFERFRPVIEIREINVPLKTDFAYPSGHASIVSSGALILVIFYRKEKDLIFSSLLIIEAALVCFSRIYVGDHYFFDIIGGALLGSGVSLLSISFSKYLDPAVNVVRKHLEKSP